MFYRSLRPTFWWAPCVQRHELIHVFLRAGGEHVISVTQGLVKRPLTRLQGPVIALLLFFGVYFPTT